MEWVGTIKACVVGHGPYLGKYIYLIETSDGDRIWRFEEELGGVGTIDRGEVLTMDMEGA